MLWLVLIMVMTIVVMVMVSRDGERAVARLDMHLWYLMVH